MILRCRLLLLIFFTSSFSLANALASDNSSLSKPLEHGLTKNLTIAVTIRPLHSLLSIIMQGTGSPVLLLDSNQSPHHYSLRPSQRSTLAHSDILFWIGEPLESFMPRVLSALPKKVKVIELINSSGLTLLAPRSEHDDHGHHQLDPHIWLSIDNAIIMAGVMADELSRLDEQRRNIYQTNLKKLTIRLQQIKKEIEKSFKETDFNYLVYHDAFQYFEQQINLKPLAAITTDEEHAPGIRHLSEINQLISKNKISCLIYNTPTLPAITRNLVNQKTTKKIYLEPLGQNLESGPDLYFNLMQSLSTGYQQCSKAR